MSESFETYKNFINKKFLYAVVGASNNREKYGNRVYRDLKSGQYNIVPVNLKEDTIEGDHNYHYISEIDPKPEVLIFVIPPIATLDVLNEAKNKGIRKAWFQPGSESKLAEEFCQQNKIAYVADKCIMVIRKLLND